MSSKFKVGDRVRQTSGEVFSNGSKEMTVWRNTGFRIWFEETATWMDESELELVTPADTYQSPVKERVVREIQSGVYGRVKVRTVGYDDEFVGICIALQAFNAQDLRHAARVFNELAEVLQNNE